jgi:hypothetical protein
MTTENLWYRSLEMLKADSRDAEAFVGHAGARDCCEVQLWGVMSGRPEASRNMGLIGDGLKNLGLAWSSGLPSGCMI